MILEIEVLLNILLVTAPPRIASITSYLVNQFNSINEGGEFKTKIAFDFGCAPLFDENVEIGSMNHTCLERAPVLR